MARKKESPEEKLIKAVESGDNLAVSKAQRFVIVTDLNNPSLEIREKTQLMSQLTKVNSDIIKLEGMKKEQSEEEAALDSGDDELRSSFGIK